MVSGVCVCVFVCTDMTHVLCMVCKSSSDGRKWKPLLQIMCGVQVMAVCSDGLGGLHLTLALQHKSAGVHWYHCLSCKHQPYLHRTIFVCVCVCVGGWRRCGILTSCLGVDWAGRLHDLRDWHTLYPQRPNQGFVPKPLNKRHVCVFLEVTGSDAIISNDNAPICIRPAG